MRALPLIVMVVIVLTCLAVQTRADYVGWQGESFDENVGLDFQPKTPTPNDPVVVTVRSRDPRVYIQVAYLYMTIQFLEGRVITAGLTFSRVNETVMSCTLSSYPNGTLVRFYVNVLDHYNVPAISGNYSYVVSGADRPGGWLHSRFEDNLMLNLSTARPNASESVHLLITSKDAVTIYGANLYIIFEIEGNKPQSGGYPFMVVNATAMEVHIPGYPPGTRVSYWVAAWDKYSNLTISPYYNYTVRAEEVYAEYPFVESLGMWVFPPMAGVVMIGILAYIAIARKETKRRKKGDLYMEVDVEQR